MNFNNHTLVRPEQETSLLTTHKVLRNTYLLLGMSLSFSGLMAWFAMAANVPFPGVLTFLIGAYGLMFLTNFLRNSPWGIVSVFAFTGFMGYTLGPFLNLFLNNYSNGGQLVMTALGGTGLIFFALSGYVLTTRKDMSFLNSFLFVGFWVLLLAVLASIFLKMPILHLAISAGFMLFSSAAILVQTSQIIEHGETNYILATINLYTSLYNLFVNLLSILGYFNNRE